MTSEKSPVTTPTGPTRGRGTLRLYGPGIIDRLDPAVGHPDARQLTRLISRQLRQLRAAARFARLAVDRARAGFGPRRALDLQRRAWCEPPQLRHPSPPRGSVDTSPPRTVTSHDMIRGFKRLANPLARPPALASSEARSAAWRSSATALRARCRRRAKDRQ